MKKRSTWLMIGLVFGTVQTKVLGIQMGVTVLVALCVIFILAFVFLITLAYYSDWRHE